MKKILLLICILPVVCAKSQNLDINILKKVNSWDTGFVRGYSKVISHSTPYLVIGLPVAMITYGGVIKNESLIKDAVYIGTSVAEAVVLTYGMKYLVDRERPFEKYPDKIDPQVHPSSPSFPSSHTASAFSLATSLSIKYPKWYVVAPSFTWACSVGFARMNEGVHYPSDVIAGAIIGSGCAVVNVYVNRWLNKWLLPEKRPMAILNY